MGVKSGTFYTLDGDKILVQLYGDAVTDGDILLDEQSPVVIQMDGGGGEYIPVQYATATITCVTDNLELYELYTHDPTNITVLITNDTTGRTLFAGYVTPNSFDQSITGCNDVATIECVDWLGAAKYTPYVKKESIALSTVTVAEVIRRITDRLWPGATILMSDYVQLCNQEINDTSEEEAYRETNKYTALTLSESCFFEDPENPEVVDGSINYDYSAMTCYDVLAMLAESFRGTFVADGTTLLLNDAVTQMAGVRKALLLDELTEQELGNTRTITEESFSAASNSLSILPIYDRFSLTRKKTETRISPPLEGKYLALNGGPILAYSDTAARPYKYVYVQNHTSELFRATRISTAASTNSGIASIWSYKRSEIYARQGLNPFWDETWETYIRVCCAPDPIDGWCSIAIAATYVLPVVESEGLSLCIKMKIAQSLERDKLYPDVLENPNSGDVFNIRVSIGGKYYNAETNQWGDTVVTNKVSTTSGDSSEWKSVFIIANDAPEGILANTTKNGRVNCTIEFGNSYAVYYIKDLELSVIESWKNKRPMPETTYRGNALPKNPYEDVSVPITFGLPKTKNTFSGVIDGVNYVGATFWTDSAGIPFAFATGKMRFVCDGVRYSWLERIERIAMMGDRKEYNLSLLDNHNDVSPFDCFTSPLWQGRKIIVGYERDIINNTIALTLN